MRIMPGPGTVVIIVQRVGEENIARIGRMTGRAGAISAEYRPDLPPLPPDGTVFLLAKVANQKMMAQGAYLGEKDSQDGFRLTGPWAPSDNRRDPRLPVRLKAEVRTKGSRATIPAVIVDLSAGGAKIEIEADSMYGEIDLLVRYGGFSSTLPAFVLRNDDDEMDDRPGADRGTGDPTSKTEGPADSTQDSDVEDSESDDNAIVDVEDDPQETSEAERSADLTDSPTSEHEATNETSDKPASEEEPAPARAPSRFLKPPVPTEEVRLMFGDLDLPQQGFLRHMLRDLAEMSGWELAS